jgi:maleylacetoacetate isomerase/maleylpyruvate isomerase
MILHEFLLSSASFRVRIALNMKGLSYGARGYKLRAGEQRSTEYLALNPAGLVPALEIDGKTITQSLAIIDYLDARYPEPPLIPKDAAERARILEIALTVACDIHPLNNLRVLQNLEKELGQDEAAVQRWCAEWITLGFQAIEGMLREIGPSPFVAGGVPGLAEICLVPQVYNARRYKVPLTDFPLLLELADRASVHPAFASAADGMPPV